MSEILLTVDALVVLDNFSKVLLIRRGKQPGLGLLALPGGHLEEGETIKAACVRELREEAGLTLDEWELVHHMYLDEPNRDIRKGRRISVVHFAVLENDDVRLNSLQAGDDAIEVCIVPLNELKSDQLAFDHWLVIERLINSLGE